MSPINYRTTLQVHTGAHAAGEDLLGQGELLGGGKSVQEVGGVLQRARHVEAERGARAVHAGQQVQGGHRLLRADSEEALRQHTGRGSGGAGQPVRFLHHDQVRVFFRQTLLTRFTLKKKYFCF